MKRIIHSKVLPLILFALGFTLLGVNLPFFTSSGAGPGVMCTMALHEKFLLLFKVYGNNGCQNVIALNIGLLLILVSSHQITQRLYLKLVKNDTSQKKKVLGIFLSWVIAFMIVYLVATYLNGADAVSAL